MLEPLLVNTKSDCFAVVIGDFSRRHDMNVLKQLKLVQRRLRELGYESVSAAGDCLPSARQLVRAIHECNFVVLSDGWGRCSCSRMQVAIAMHLHKFIYCIDAESSDLVMADEIYDQRSV